MLPDWHTNVAYFSGLLPSRHPGLWEAIAGILGAYGVAWRLLERTRDIWARDHCPIQVGPGRFVKFRYAPDYLRGFPHLRTGNELCEELGCLGDIQPSDIVLDGGNVVGSPETAILTEKVFHENPRYSKTALRTEIEKLLEVSKCIFIPIEEGDPIGHSDGMVRFVGAEAVVMNEYSRLDPALGRRLRRRLSRAGLEIELLPYFYELEVSAVGKTTHSDIPSAVGNYVNFLRVGDLILAPAYGRKEDEAACRILESVCPQATVVPVDSRRLAAEGGVLNCISWTIKVGAQQQRDSSRPDVYTATE